MFAKRIARLFACLFVIGAMVQATQAAVPNGTIFANTNNPPEQWTTTLEVNTSAGHLSFSQVVFPPESSPCVLCLGGRGWYGSSGRHNWDAVNNVPTVNLNYIASVSGVRNYFVFGADLGGATAMSAYLHLQNPGAPNPGFGGAYSTLDYRVWDVTTPLANVVAPSSGGSAGLAIWSDLGSGINYGSRLVSAADNGTFIDVALNIDALAAINIAAHGPGYVGFGGSLLVPVPEPEAGVLMLSGLFILGFIARRRNRNLASR